MTHQEIATQTHRLNKPQWLKVITRLHNNFKGYPFDDERQEPLNAIGQILIDLKSGRFMEEQFKERVSRLDCFTFRAYFIDPETDEAVYWNPLETPFSDFSKNQTLEYQADIEYPAPDIIRQWFYLKLCDKSKR